MDSNLLPDLQSAYQANHSMETAVLEVVSDILAALDLGDLAALVLIDLSAAFDTVDHVTLLWWLHGLDGVAINWRSSYLSGRTQCVHTSTTTPISSLVQCAVPQGLVLLYAADMLQHNLQPHTYADDTSSMGSVAVSIPSACKTEFLLVSMTSSWMRASQLH